MIGDMVPQEADQILHQLLYWVAEMIGHDIGAQVPSWMHPALHVVLIMGPLALAVLVVFRLIAWFRCCCLPQRHEKDKTPTTGEDHVRGFEPGIFAFVLRWSRGKQAVLIGLGIVAMPLLYATLELPKLIVNGAIDSGHFPVRYLGTDFDQLSYLYVLCALYLVAILANSALKLVLNIYKSRVGERLLRRLRLGIYRRWREGAGGLRRGEVTPLIAQEVEPMGGFAADALALPVFQGGVFVTILFFMFAQDPILGAAALTMLPVQLAIIPRLQRRVNSLARERVANVRTLGGQLGVEAQSEIAPNPLKVAGTLRRIETVRQKIHRVKFFMKALNNVLTSLTPFLFYAIGGYLVIEGRLSLGGLVAVMAAYKDFSAPLRELFRYYQQLEDVRVRYGELLRFLAVSSSARESGSICDIGSSEQPQERLGRLSDLQAIPIPIVSGSRPISSMAPIGARRLSPQWKRRV